MPAWLRTRRELADLVGRTDGRNLAAAAHRRADRSRRAAVRYRDHICRLSHDRICRRLPGREHAGIVASKRPIFTMSDGVACTCRCGLHLYLLQILACTARADSPLTRGRKPELTEAQKTLAKKRQELARVIERLRSLPLSHGIARELRKEQAILEREIAELEQA